ncbi:hypothetical protein HMPREF0774_0158 [Staphylococcus aureus subsp. aureus TCH130]|nr:hypothetical protein HMPREF0774_0158 [Staphylococcus aureus subsp. aureus TCH130]
MYLINKIDIYVTFHTYFSTNISNWRQTLKHFYTICMFFKILLNIDK